MSVRSPKSPQRLDWIVYFIAGPKARRIGTVTAADEESALAAAVVEFDIAPAERRRLVVRPTG